MNLTDSFPASRFVDLDCGNPDKVYMTAAEKARICKAFARFVECGFSRERFTRSMYNSLNSMFGFIAHFDIDGFYSVKFGDDVRRRNTLAFIRDYREYYGNPRFTRSDMERALIEWLRSWGGGRHVIDALERKIAAENEAWEREELARLEAKYGRADAWKSMVNAFLLDITDSEECECEEKDSGQCWHCRAESLLNAGK